MATSSIFKNVTIKKAAQAKQLIGALEGSQGKSKKAVVMQKKVSFPDGAQIQKMFEK